MVFWCATTHLRVVSYMVTGTRSHASLYLFSVCGRAWLYIATLDYVDARQHLTSCPTYIVASLKNYFGCLGHHNLYLSAFAQIYISLCAVCDVSFDYIAYKAYFTGIGIF